MEQKSEDAIRIYEFKQKEKEIKKLVVEEEFLYPTALPKT
jgi:hypothetical protein